MPKCTICQFVYTEMTQLRVVSYPEKLCTIYHCPSCGREVCRDYFFGNISEDMENMKNINIKETRGKRGKHGKD